MQKLISRKVEEESLASMTTSDSYEFNLYVCSAASYVVGFVGGVLEKLSECGGGQNNKISHGGPSTAFPQVGHC